MTVQQDNSSAGAGLGMVAAWGVAVILALLTVIFMLRAKCAKSRGCVTLKLLSRLTLLLALGIIVATMVSMIGRQPGGGGHVAEDSYAGALLACGRQANFICRGGQESLQFMSACASGMLAAAIVGS